MSGREQHVELGAAIATALRDGVGRWGEENPGGESIGERLAQYAKAIEVHGRITVGGPMMLVVEVIDRRPGRSSLASYVLERSPKGKTLFRKQV